MISSRGNAVYGEALISSPEEFEGSRLVPVNIPLRDAVPQVQGIPVPDDAHVTRRHVGEVDRIWPRGRPAALAREARRPACALRRGLHVERRPPRVALIPGDGHRGDGFRASQDEADPLAVLAGPPARRQVAVERTKNVTTSFTSVGNEADLTGQRRSKPGLASPAVERALAEAADVAVSTGRVPNGLLDPGMVTMASTESECHPVLPL
jgi:hypothetical protein